LGYFGGAQHGWSVWLQRGNKHPDWVVVSNVDVSIDDHEFFNRLASAVYPDHVGVVGPSICSQARQGDWNPKIRSRPSARRMHGYKKLYNNHIIFNGYEALSRVKFRLQRFVRWLRKERRPAAAAGVEIIYAPHGAFMLFSRLYVERGGDFRHPAFLFCEEIFVAETARALELKVVYDPSLRITSVDHVSTGTFRSRKMVGYMREAAVAIADKYFAE
jgi:GT2 family glycosyltransferase